MALGGVPMGKHAGAAGCQGHWYAKQQRMHAGCIGQAAYHGGKNDHLWATLLITSLTKSATSVTRKINARRLKANWANQPPTAR